MNDDFLSSAIAALWQKELGPVTDIELSPCAVSGNNRVFKVRCGDRTAVAKWYFSGPNDTRDRLDAEWRFLTYAASADIACVPRPLARDDAARLALHQWFDGARPAARSIGPAEVGAASGLFRALNRSRPLAMAAHLPEAAEACFSLASHVTMVNGRMNRLPTIHTAAPLDAEAADLVRQMTQYWDAFRAGLPERAAAAGIDFEAPLPPEQRCVSPSDFGFHNALVDAAGTIRFVDFEYGGWDDPAKMVCDFFLQPAIKVAGSYRESFFADTVGNWPDAERLARRVDLLMPLFAVKWCCIMLNPFVPSLAGRGQFARPTEDQDSRKRRGLANASAAFTALKGSI